MFHKLKTCFSIFINLKKAKKDMFSCLNNNVTPKV